MSLTSWRCFSEEDEDNEKGRGRRRERDTAGYCLLGGVSEENEDDEERRGRRIRERRDTTGFVLLRKLNIKIRDVDRARLSSERHEGGWLYWNRMGWDRFRPLQDAWLDLICVDRTTWTGPAAQAFRFSRRVLYLESLREGGAWRVGGGASCVERRVQWC